MKKKKFTKDIKSINYVELNKFYVMLLKYKQKNPNFKIKKVFNKLYPNLDWSKIK